MNKILLIGASGQLGSNILQQLTETSQECSVLVRTGSSLNIKKSNKPEIIPGDLSNFDSVNAACTGIKNVITTASTIVPGKNDKSADQEIENYRNLIKACQLNKVEHIVYISGFSASCDYLAPKFKIIQIKRQIEQLIIDSGIPYTIFRGSAFMDVYFSVMGSHIVTNGVSQPTLLRGYWLTRLYAKLTSGLMENHGIALITGKGKVKQTFICVKDVASFMVKALTVPTAKNRTIELGGPQVLSWNDVADIYAKVLNKKITKIPLPSVVINASRLFLRLFSPASDHIFGILYLYSRYSSEIDMRELSKEFGVNMTDARAFLLEKLDSGQTTKDK